MGNINVWNAFSHPADTPVTYNDALRSFLTILKNEHDIEHEIGEISLKNLLNETDITHFNEIIPNTNPISEFSVHPPNLNTEPYHVTQQYISKFVKMGKMLENQGNYKGAFEFYEVSQLQGIKDLSRMLFETKNWVNLRFYLEILLLFYPNDEEVFRMAAICYERVNEPEKALEIYGKYQGQSDFMKIGFYRLSQIISHDKSSCILAINKIITNPDIYDPYMLEQVIRLSLHFKKIEFGLNCCFRNAKTIKLLSLFTKNAVFYEKVVDFTTKYLSTDYRAAIRTIFILYKHGDRNIATDIANSIRPRKKGGYMQMQRFYPIMFLLFTDFRYEEMVARFSKFFSILATFSNQETYSFENPQLKAPSKKYEDFTFLKLVQRLQKLPQFKHQINLNIEIPENCDSKSFQRLVRLIESDFFDYEANPEFQGVNEHFCEDFEKLNKYDEKVAFYSIMILLCAYLFVEGHLKDCQELIVHLELMIKLFLLSTEQAHHQPKFDDEIIQLFVSIQRSLISRVSPRFSESTGKFYVVGDEFVNLLAYEKFSRGTIVNQFLPRSIPGLTLYDLRHLEIFTHGKNKSIPSPSVAYIPKLHWRKMAFYDLLEHILQMDSLTIPGIMFMIGTNDCEQIIPKYTNNLVFKSVVEAIEEEITIFLEIINKVHSSIPRVELFVHSVIPRFKWSATIANLFNQKLKEKLPDYVCFVNPFNVASIIDPVNKTVEQNIHQQVAKILEA